MIAALWAWAGGKLAGPLAIGAALLLGAGLLWQTARIEGLPLLGGGLKAQVAHLQQDIAVRARIWLRPPPPRGRFEPSSRRCPSMSAKRAMMLAWCLGALCGCSTPPPAAPPSIMSAPPSPPASLMTPPRTLRCLRLSPCLPPTLASPGRMRTS